MPTYVGRSLTSARDCERSQEHCADALCWVKKGDYVETGQRFGLIRFGSRLELYLPPDSTLTVRKGEKVRAGQTVIGYLGEIEEEK